MCLSGWRASGSAPTEAKLGLLLPESAPVRQGTDRLSFRTAEMAMAEYLLRPVYDRFGEPASEP